MASIVEAAGTTEPRARARRGLPEVLPELTGRRYRAFKLVWLLLFGLALVAPLAGTYLAWKETRDDGFAQVGLRWRSDGRTMSMRPPASEEARRSGVSGGDVVLGVDGRPVPHSITSVGILRDRLAGPEGSKVTITVRSADGTIRNHRLTRTSGHEQEAYAGSPLSGAAVARLHLVLGLVPALVLVPAAALIFARRRRDSVAALLSLSLLTIAASFMAGANFLVGALDAPWLLRLAQGGWIVLAIVLLVFPDGRFRPRWTALLSFAGIAWVLIYMTGAVSARWNQFASLSLLLSGVIAAATRYRKMPHDAKRQQIRWVLFGFTAGALFMMGSFALRVLIDDYATDDQRWGIWGLLLLRACLAGAVLCFALGLLVSILRYRLYDAEAVISRSAGYAVLTALMAATFGGTAKGLEIFFETYFGQEAGVLPGVIGAGFAVALITPLNNRIQAWADRRFQKGLAHLRRDLPECASDLRETAALGELAEELLDRVWNGVRASRAALLVGGDTIAARDVDSAAVAQWRAGNTPDENAESLDCDRDDPIFPVRLSLRVRHGGGTPIGWILLGPRPDGSFYGKDEREALAEIADPVARALQVALLRQEREARQEARVTAIERKLARALKALGGARQLSGKAATSS